MKKFAAVAVLLAAFVSTANAESIVFDFESQVAGAPTDSIVLTQGAYSIQITRASGLFEFVDLSPFAGPGGVPTSWGARTLSPFTDFSDPSEFVITVLSQPAGMAILDINASFGDFSPSDIDYITYDGTNITLDNSLSAGFFATGFASTIDAAQGGGPLGHTGTSFDGGSDGQRQSLFWDNITLVAVASGDLPMGVVAPAFTDSSDPTGGAGGIPSSAPIPEPGTIGLCAAALVAIAYRRRRRRS